MPYKDAEVRKKYWTEWYNKNKSRLMKGYIEKSKLQKEKLKRVYKTIKGTKHCLFCGETHIACLEFHHLLPEVKETLEEDDNPLADRSDRSLS